MDLKLEGRQGKSVIVDGSNIRITKKGWLFAAQREKALPIRNISSVEIKKPGLMGGYIKFSIAGGFAHDSTYKVTGGTYDALQDENAVVFNGKDNYQIALMIKEAVESKSSSVPIQTTGISAADEIIKLKKLLDDGVLTKDEFAAKKKQLLGL